MTMIISSYRELIVWQKSMGSAAELETQLTLSERLKIGDPGLLKDCQSLLVEVQKMLPSMMKSLRK